MSPTISPSATSRLTPARASRPPNRFRTSATSRSATSGARPAACPNAPEVRVCALGQEQHDRDEEHAVDDEVKAGPARPGEVEPRDLGQRREDEGAEQGPQQRPGAADDGPDDDVDRERDAEDGIRLQGEQVV